MIAKTLGSFLVVLFFVGAGLPRTASAHEIRVVKDVPYYEGADADPIKHKLDLYVPADRTDFPVLFFIHGGAWVHGDKKFMGVYETLGKYWAGRGIGMVVTNYRLSPKVKHPEHIKDVARAFAWTHKNIAKYGGRADQVFVCGHSAGGHLAALLATDESYLKTQRLALRDIRGVIPISGVYRIPDGDPFFDRVFTKDDKVRKEASPLEHVAAGDPPFLIICAETDLPLCSKSCSEAFCKAFDGKKCRAQVLEVKKRSHISVLFNAHKDDDPVVQAIHDFITRNTRE